MVTIKNPRALLAYAQASNSLDALITWLTVMEERDDQVYKIICRGDDTFLAEIRPVCTTYANQVMFGELIYHDYTETPYWSVHT